MSAILYHRCHLVSKVIAVFGGQVMVVEQIVVIVITVPLVESIVGAIDLLVYGSFAPSKVLGLFMNIHDCRY